MKTWLLNIKQYEGINYEGSNNEFTDKWEVMTHFYQEVEYCENYCDKYNVKYRKHYREIKSVDKNGIKRILKVTEMVDGIVVSPYIKGE